jgi:hypothetical protein
MIAHAVEADSEELRSVIFNRFLWRPEALSILPIKGR